MITFDCRLARPAFTLDATFEAGTGITALFGTSGSGKSTIVRLLAGLERPDRGRIAVADRTFVDTTSGAFLKPWQRRAAMVFQDSQLFPHLTVRRNLDYGRRLTPKAERRVAPEAVIGILGIEALLERYPATLSGGERQRVAIGRALLASPRVLLMDEPLASLDADRRLEILPFIERLRDDFGVPILYVSHAVEEVARLAATVVRLDQGRVIAVGSPAEVLTGDALARPGERFHRLSILNGTFARHLPEYGVSVIAHPAGEIVVAGQMEARGPVRVAVQATNVTLAIGRPTNISVRTALHGRIIGLETDDGPFAHVAMALAGGDRLEAFATRLAIDRLGLDVGDEVTALIKAVAIDEKSVPGLSAGRHQA